MTFAKFGLFVVTLGLAGLVVLMFLKTQGVDWAKHEQYTEAVFKVQGINADLNKNILKVRYRLLEYYDILVSQLAVLKNLQRTLADIPPAIDAPGQSEIKQSFEILAGLIAEKEALLERFKSKNAVLKNSVQYLPLALREAKDELQDKKLASRLEGLLWDLLQYNIVAGGELEQSIQGQLKALAAVRNESASAADRETLDGPLAHARTVLEQTPVVNALTDNLTWLPIGQWGSTLGQAYRRHHARALATAERYRWYVYGTAAMFVLYTLFLALWQPRKPTPILMTTNVNDAQHRPEDSREEAAPIAADLLKNHRYSRKE